MRLHVNDANTSKPEALLVFNVDVRLDGEELRDCIYASEEDGYVVRLFFAQGSPPAKRRAYGRVFIGLAKDAPLAVRDLYFSLRRDEQARRLRRPTTHPTRSKNDDCNDD